MAQISLDQMRSSGSLTPLARSSPRHTVVSQTVFGDFDSACYTIRYTM